MNNLAIQIVESCISVLLRVQREVLELVWKDPLRCFEPFIVSAGLKGSQFGRFKLSQARQ